MERREFLKLWPLKYAADNWTLARMRLDAGKLPTATAAANERPANLAESVQYGAGKPHQHAGVGSPNLLA